MSDLKKKIDVEDTAIEDRVQLQVTKMTELLNDQINRATSEYRELVQSNKTNI